jgi:hypothetical protein
MHAETDTDTRQASRVGLGIGYALAGVILAVVTAFLAAPVWWALQRVWGWAL